MNWEPRHGPDGWHRLRAAHAAAHAERFHRWHSRHWRAHPRLLRSIFVWLALSILVTVLSVALVVRVLTPGEHARPFRVEQLEALIARQFADVWADGPRRQELVKDWANTVAGASVRLVDPSGRTIEKSGECKKPDYTLEVKSPTGVKLGRVQACFKHSLFHGPIGALVILLTAATVLWLVAAALAHKLTKPLFTLIEVTREIGRGKLKSRVRLGRYQRGELGILADSVNEMAERIERQLNEQRELLAVVSHEVRSPLARLRLSSELLRDNPSNRQALEAMEREVCELDALIGKLLASSRLDFGSIERVPLDPLALARTALARRDLSAELLEAELEGVTSVGDPTLVARALDNLLENAERHGHSVLRLIARPATAGEHKDPAHAVVFEVWDKGPGFDEASLPKVFDAFTRAPTRSGPAPSQNGSAQNGSSGHVSLGLGLSLVRRIAEAHGGRAWADNLPSGGARVGLSVG